MGANRGRKAVRFIAWSGGLLVAAIALVFVFPSAYLWGASHIWDKAEHEIHLIPAGFRGPVVIVFNEAGGAPKEFERKARLYRIPADGVLRTQFGPNPGWGRPDYWYINAVGQRTAIVPGTPCDDELEGDPVQACLAGRRYRINGLPSPEYSSYVVGQTGERRAAYEAGEQLVGRLLFGDVP